VNYTDQETLGKKLLIDYKIQPLQTLQSCSTCHR
jgi:cytochrome c peroxidase